MNYTLAIYGAPQSSQAPATALAFAKAVLARGHQIHRLFFYLDGVHCATALTTPPQDEPNLPQQWQEFITANKLDAVVCIAAALRRGVIDAAEAERYGRPGHNMSEAFDLSGLGQLIESIAESDRLVSFGG